MEDLGQRDAVPTGAAVARTLAAVFASPEFARAPVMRHLLGFLVNETLAGRGDRLKAYSVAVDALGRSPDFDAQVDSYPRVQVGRLRKMLDAYHASADVAEWRIAIPLGGYRVAFTRNDEPPAAGTDSGNAQHETTPRPRRRAAIAAAGAAVMVAIGVAIYSLWPADLPDATPAPVAAPTITIEVGDTSSTPRGRILLAEVARAIATPLSRSWLVTVVTGAASVNSRYALLVDLDAAEQVVSLRLVDRSDGRLVWSDQAALEDGPAAMQLRQQISVLVRPSGVIGAQQRASFAGHFTVGYPCLLQFDAYYRDRTPALAAPVRRCIAATIAAQPDDAQAAAAASFLMFDPLAGGGPQGQRAALAFAERASRLAPYLPAAAVAETRIAITGGNCTRGRIQAERAVALDAHDSETLGLIGMLLIGCDPGRAANLLREARTLDADLTTFYMPALVLLDLRAGDRARAIEQARGMRPTGAGMRAQYLLAQTLSAIAAGDDARARRLWAGVIAATPPSRPTMDDVLAHHYFAADFRRLLGDTLAGAGLTVPPRGA